MLVHPFLPERVLYGRTGVHPAKSISPKEKNMKFPKQLSVIFLILFLLAFGIGYFILGTVLAPAAAVLAIVTAILYLIGK
jgi:uncharacterized membrane protein YphA (DoxX/SURF4 family)